MSICGAHRQAAEAYQRIGELTRAAEMFGRCQDYQQSAALYEETGDSGQAARMYGEAGLFYRAALAAKQDGLTDLAIAHLQKVAVDSPNYQASLVELAAHFKDRGLPGVAVEKLRKAIGEDPLSADNIDLYYAMAEACQEMGDIERACEILVSIYDMGIERGRLFIIMEYVEGASYYKILDREVRLPINAVLHFMLGVLKALAHAHSHGVVHRDIKPSNVMLTRRRTVKIADFGLAKIL